MATFITTAVITSNPTQYYLGIRTRALERRLEKRLNQPERVAEVGDVGIILL
jgi:hypothetical protein